MKVLVMELGNMWSAKVMGNKLSEAASESKLLWGESGNKWWREGLESL